MFRSLDYQIERLADTIQQASKDGSLEPEETAHLRKQLQDVDSLAEIHDVWDLLTEEHDHLEAPM